MSSTEFHPDNLFHSILSDHTSGSGNILQKCMVLVESVSRESMLFPDKPGFQLKAMFKRMKLAFPSFAVVHHFADQCIQFLETGGHDSGTESFSTFLRDYQNFWSAAGRTLADRFHEIVDLRQKTLLLHSQSGTVLDMLAACDPSKHPKKVYQTESRPAMEGWKQAEKIIRMGIPVVVLTDSAVSRIIGEIDYFISGADWISDTSFINKIGTRSIALLCMEEHKPCYLLADSRKYRPVDGELKNVLDTDHGPGELRDHVPEGIRVMNIYFEDIPLAYTSRLFSE